MSKITKIQKVSYLARGIANLKAQTPKTNFTHSAQ